MNRRKYLKSVASTPILPIFNGLDISDESESESEFVFNSVWHRGEQKGHILTPTYAHNYSSYESWKSATVIHSSLNSFDVTPFYQIEDIDLISVNISSSRSLLVNKNKKEIRIVDDDDVYYIAVYDQDSTGKESYYCKSITAVERTLEKYV